MTVKMYIAHLILEDKEITRVVGRRGETIEELRRNILESLSLVISEVVIDAPEEMLEDEVKH